jgi:hypothetical protein
MARFWHLQIDDLYFTSTGDENGRFCRVNFPGAFNLWNKQGNTSDGADGSPFNETPLTEGRGIPIEISIPSVDTDPVFNDLKTLMIARQADNLEVTIIGEGEPGNFEIKGVVHFAPVPFQFGSFVEDQVNDIILRFKTTEIVSIS